jgi:hypothetical protein
VYGIQGFLNGQSKWYMKNKHLSQTKRYQLYVIMKKLGVIKRKLPSCSIGTSPPLAGN